MGLTARIKNISASAVTVSTYSPAVIGVSSITYHASGSIGPNTVTLTPTAKRAEFVEDPNSIASLELVTLAPQSSIQFPINVIYRLDLTVGQEPTVFIYNPRGSGAYTLRFQYFYSGPDTTFPNVYHFAVSARPITVQVTLRKFPPI